MPVFNNILDIVTQLGKDTKVSNKH